MVPSLVRMPPFEADPFGAQKPAPVSFASAPAMALSTQPKEVAEEVARAAQLRRVDTDIEHLMRARYPLIYILSSEERRVEESIKRVLESREKEKGHPGVEYPLPGLSEINRILERVARMVSGTKVPLAQDREHIVEAALGLTADESESVFAKSLVQTGGSFDIDIILSEKERIVRKSGVLEFFRTREQMDDIGGLDQLKTWLKKRQRAFSEEARVFGLPRPKGILMIGIPGGGKSLTAKAVRSEEHTSEL